MGEDTNNRFTAGANVFTIVMSIATVVMLVFLWIQIDELKNATQANTAQAIAETILDFDRMFVENPERAEVWGNDTIYYNQNDMLETQKNWTVIMAIDFYENLYFQYKKNTLDEDLWGGWQTHIKDEFFHENRSHIVWNELRDNYSEDFRECMNNLANNATCTG